MGFGGAIDMADTSGKEESREVEYRIPPYFDRYQEEREKRYQSELHRVEEAVDRNSDKIDELKEDMDRRFGEVDRRFGELREDIGQRFDEQAFWMKLMFGTLASMMVAITSMMVAVLIKLF